MLKTKSFLCLDVGAGSLKMAEFEPTEEGGLRLRQFGVIGLGLEGSQEAKREAAVLRGLQQLIAERGFHSKNANVSAPGFHVFSKFVKLPPVDTSKVTQIIQYEAQQNVPFPLEEVVWDYQILGSSPGGELEVLLVAIKTDIVEGLFRTAEAAALRLQLVDVSPAALTNAFRFNYSGLDGCTMLLDIGAKTSNVLFFEKGKVFARGINIGANSITQDFATESKLPFPEAERLKIEEGFVSLGGAYEEPESPRQAQISKIARQVMTRLHIQVNQTIQFYRSQQGGSTPQRVFLAGGASVMPFTAQFFAEKLNLAVEYFNPFVNVQIDPGVNLEELEKVAHSFGEVVGLGLRSVAQCPVELNLMPKSSLKRQQFNQKKPYLIATLFSLILVVFAYGWFYAKLTSVKNNALNDLMEVTQPLQTKAASLEQEERTLAKAKQQAEQITQWIQQRFYWIDLLHTLRQAFVHTEQTTRGKFGIEAGVWIENFSPVIPGQESAVVETTASESSGMTPYMMDPELMKRYGLAPQTSAAPAAEPEAVSTNEIATIKLVCRAVNMASSPSANKLMALDLETRLKEMTNWFEPSGTMLAEQIEVADPGAPTFTFELTLKLANPIKL